MSPNLTETVNGYHACCCSASSSGPPAAAPVSAPRCGGGCSLPHCGENRGARLGFFECHVCLLHKNKQDETAVSRICNAVKNSSARTADSAHVYRLSASNTPPALQRNNIGSSGRTCQGGAFLLLLPPESLASQCLPPNFPDSPLRCWRVTSVVDATESCPAAKLGEPQGAQQPREYEEREPWDDVISRIARWLTADRLSATVLVLGGNRGSRASRMFHYVDSTAVARQGVGMLWRPCIAQRACAEVFALSKLKRNSCKQETSPSLIVAVAVNGRFLPSLVACTSNRLPS